MMHFKIPSLLITLTLLLTKPSQSQPQPSEFVQGNPICAVGGFTQVPGNYTQTTHQQSGATLRSCFNECKEATPSCKSIAFHERYTLCLWFDQVVEKTQLVYDVESEFLHWDLKCYLTAAGTKREVEGLRIVNR